MASAYTTFHLRRADRWQLDAVLASDVEETQAGFIIGRGARLLSGESGCRPETIVIDLKEDRWQTIKSADDGGELPRLTKIASRAWPPAIRWAERLAAQASGGAPRRRFVY